MGKTLKPKDFSPWHFITQNFDIFRKKSLPQGEFLRQLLNGARL